jgi:hypothetical protein
MFVSILRQERETRATAQGNSQEKETTTGSSMIMARGDWMKAGGLYILLARKPETRTRKQKRRRRPQQTADQDDGDNASAVAIYGAPLQLTINGDGSDDHGDMATMKLVVLMMVI